MSKLLRVDGDWEWIDKTDMDWAGLNNNWAPGEPNDNRDITYSEEDKLEIFKIYHHSFGLNDTPARKGYKSFVCKVPCL